MNKTKVLNLTLTVPVSLKLRLENAAKFQGVSLNQLSNYLLNEQLIQLEMISSLESRLSKKSEDELKSRVKNILDKVPSNDPPVWDRII